MQMGLNVYRYTKAKFLSQPPQHLVAQLADPDVSNTKKRRLLKEVQDGAKVRARYLAHAGLLMVGFVTPG
jgi:hypothetical protein